MNKTALIIITLAILFVFGFIFFGGSGQKEASLSNVEMKDGVQYVRISAKGGYSPALTTAKAGIPTKLVVETSNTFDCSSALVVRDANFQQILPKSGETVIDLGIPESGNPLEGVCGMGMYSFKVNFEDPAPIGE